MTKKEMIEKLNGYEKVLKEYANIDNWESGEHANNIYKKDYAYIEAKEILEGYNE